MTGAPNYLIKTDEKTKYLLFIIIFFYFQNLFAAGEGAKPMKVDWASKA